MRTVPVNQSAGPWLEGCEPLRLISIFNSFGSFLICLERGCVADQPQRCD
jgi:hypothetical protein